MEKYHCTDANKWAKAHLDELNQAEAESSIKSLFRCCGRYSFLSISRIPITGGYLFLQKIYYDLRLPNICEDFKEYSFSYDLDSILSRLVYERILNPSSKLPAMSSPPICSNHRL